MRIGERFTRAEPCLWSPGHAAVVTVEQMTRYRRSWLDCYACKKAKGLSAVKIEAEDAKPAKKKAKARKR